MKRCASIAKRKNSLGALLIVLALLCAGCTTVTRPDPTDFSGTKRHEAFGLSLTLPKAFKRFDEGTAVAFRPDPPSRTSPGVLVQRHDNADAMRVLDAAYRKIATQMSGLPEPIQGRVGEQEVMGIYSELVTHLIWIYAPVRGDTVWTLQIIVPVDWTDETALAFHDFVCQNVRFP
ncbi:MAG TPA: hypothetical protein PKW95_05075 [bacterium]|nr:hypothetical protein [bacterium]